LDALEKLIKATPTPPRPCALRCVGASSMRAAATVPARTAAITCSARADRFGVLQAARDPRSRQAYCYHLNIAAQKQSKAEVRARVSSLWQSEPRFRSLEATCAIRSLGLCQMLFDHGRNKIVQFGQLRVAGNWTGTSPVPPHCGVGLFNGRP
jgi:hypothetical protein